MLQIKCFAKVLYRRCHCSVLHITGLGPDKGGTAPSPLFLIDLIPCPRWLLWRCLFVLLIYSGGVCLCATRVGFWSVHIWVYWSGDDEVAEDNGTAREQLMEVEMEIQ